MRKKFKRGRREGIQITERKKNVMKIKTIVHDNDADKKKSYKSKNVRRKFKIILLYKHQYINANKVLLTIYTFLFQLTKVYLYLYHDIMMVFLIF